MLKRVQRRGRRDHPARKYGPLRILGGDGEKREGIRRRIPGRVTAFPERDPKAPEFGGPAILQRDVFDVATDLFEASKHRSCADIDLLRGSRRGHHAQ